MYPKTKLFLWKYMDFDHRECGKIHTHKFEKPYKTNEISTFVDPKSRFAYKNN